MDRRAAFFVLASIICALLYVPTPEDLRFVPAWLAGVYLVLALLSFLDYRSRLREARALSRREALAGTNEP